MTIEKNTKNTLAHEEPAYTTLLNEVVHNIHHTGALGMYCYLASKPANWDICKKHLQNHFKCGREHINACFKYLRKIGAIEVFMIRDEKGQVTEWETVLKRKLPLGVGEINQNASSPAWDLSRIRVSQNVGFPESGFPAPINKRYIKIKDNINNKTLVDFDKSPSEFEEDEFEMYAGILEYHDAVFERCPDLVEEYVWDEEEDITTSDSLISPEHEVSVVSSDEVLQAEVVAEVSKVHKPDYRKNHTENKPTSSKIKHSLKDYEKDVRFMAFYGIYPNKKKPWFAYKAFLQLRPGDELLNRLIADVKARHATEWKNRPKKMIPHPATYLNKGEWEGEIDDYPQKETKRYGQSNFNRQWGSVLC